MQKILGRRVLRDLKNNAFRYASLGFLVCLGMYLVVSLVGAAETVIVRVDEYAAVNQLEDGEFTVFVPLVKQQEEKLIHEGIALEKKFSIDLSLEDNSVIRMFENRPRMNRLMLEEGRQAETLGEAAAEKRYCEEHGIRVGDTLDVGGEELKIVGIGTVPDYDGLFQKLSDSSANSSRFGLIFVTKEQYKDIKESNPSAKSEDYTYAYQANGKMPDKEVKEKIKEFSITSKEGQMSNLTQFVAASDNARIKASASDMSINKYAGLIVGVIVMILFTYVISVFVVHGIEKESSVIGTLYALGIKKRSLMLHYLLLPLAVTFTGGIIGTLLGFSRIGIPLQMISCYGYFSVPTLPVVYPGYLILYGITMPPAAAVMVNCFVIDQKLSYPALKLIKNEKKSSRIRGINLGKLSFPVRFCIRQMVKEARSGMTVLFGLLLSLMLLMMGLNCYIMCENISVKNRADTKFEYMYTYKYPDAQTAAGGEAGFAKTLSRPVFGKNMDVVLLGIHEDNPYFDAAVEKGKNKVLLSSAAAQKYDLGTGDKITLSDREEERDYVFTISGITQYSVGLYVFMDIADMRKLFGARENYYNVVFSGHELAIDAKKLYGITSRADIAEAADVFIGMMASLVFTLCGVSVIVFCIVMYLMMKVMVERSSFGIALIKIFGYRTQEMKKLYLDGNFYIVALGAAACIPLAKKLVDTLYPVILSNVACGMDLAFPGSLYLVIYGGILLLYVVISRVLVGRLKYIQPAEVLKNRE